MFWSVTAYLSCSAFSAHNPSVQDFAMFFLRQFRLCCSFLKNLRCKVFGFFVREKTTWIAEIAIAQNCLLQWWLLVHATFLAVLMLDTSKLQRALAACTLWWCQMMCLGPGLQKTCSNSEKSQALPSIVEFAWFGDICKILEGLNKRANFSFHLPSLVPQHHLVTQTQENTKLRRKLWICKRDEVNEGKTKKCQG